MEEHQRTRTVSDLISQKPQQELCFYACDAINSNGTRPSLGSHSITKLTQHAQTYRIGAHRICKKKRLCSKVKYTEIHFWGQITHSWSSCLCHLKWTIYYTCDSPNECICTLVVKGYHFHHFFFFSFQQNTKFTIFFCGHPQKEMNCKKKNHYLNDNFYQKNMRIVLYGI